jgi:hypothetical protein
VRRGSARALARALAFIALALLPLASFAQGGPPLITNDPDTPGDGNWEINIAAIGTHADGAWELSLPDLDINYGLGERIQLSVNVGNAHAREEGSTARSGIGPVELAFRYRFLDEEKSGFSLAVQPHWARSWSQAAIRKGLAPEHDELGVPVQVARHFGEATVGGELGRNFIASEPDEWQFGAFWSRDCIKGLNCLLEVNAVRADGGSTDTIVNVGARHEFNEHFVLQGSLGRQVAGEPQTVFYLGVQLLR